MLRKKNHIKVTLLLYLSFVNYKSKTWSYELTEKYNGYLTIS